MTDTAITDRAPNAGQPASLWNIVVGVLANLTLIAFGLLIGAMIGLLVAGIADWLPPLEC